MNEQFFCPEHPALHGTEKPRGWGWWSPWRRCQWLRTEGPPHAADLLEAYEILMAAGDWPTERQLRDMEAGEARIRRLFRVCGGRGNSRRKCRAPDGQTGRQDRLKDYY